MDAVRFDGVDFSHLVIANRSYINLGNMRDAKHTGFDKNSRGEQFWATSLVF